MHLIALVGFKGSGKDTAGQFLVENYGFKSFSFAESLKDALASIFCWDRTLLEGHTAESRAWRETVDEWWADKLGMPGLTPRWVMQNVGTNVFRQHFHHDIWIHNIERKLTMLPEDSKVVFTDGRFPNELNLGRKYGGKVIRVRRGAEPVWFNVAAQANGHKLRDSGYMYPNFAYKKEAVEAMEHQFKVHQSEWAWIGEPIDHTIDNDLSIEHLHAETLRLCL